MFANCGTKTPVEPVLAAPTISISSISPFEGDAPTSTVTFKVSMSRAIDQAVTIDFATLGEKGPELLDTVTVRERDSNAQHRVKIAELKDWLLARIS